MDIRKAEKLKRSFAKKYAGKAGRVERETGQVIVKGVVLATDSESLRRDFKCEPHEQALLVTCIALERHDFRTLDPKAEPMLFPRFYFGLTVHYRNAVELPASERVAATA